MSLEFIDWFGCETRNSYPPYGCRSFSTAKMTRKKNKYPQPSLRKATKKIGKGTFKTHSKMIVTSAPGVGPPPNPIGVLEARPPCVTHEEKKVEKDNDTVAGFIFMCSGKTKPECYQFRVFGLPMGRLEVVKKVKPGAKLFLFDFNLKLLYGVYEATSGGDLDIEPMAFDQKFRSQVSRNFRDDLFIASKEWS